MNLYSISALCAAALFATAAHAASAPSSIDASSVSTLGAPSTVLAREAESGDDRGRGGRGRRGDDGKGHRAIDDAPFAGDELLARAERGHHGGRSRPAGKRGV